MKRAIRNILAASVILAGVAALTLWPTWEAQAQKYPAGGGAVSASGAVSAALIPNATNTYDLGSSSFTFKNLYLGGLNVQGSNVTGVNTIRVTNVCNSGATSCVTPATAATVDAPTSVSLTVGGAAKLAVASGGTTIGASGSTIATVLKGTATIDFAASGGSNVCDTSSITVTGAADGDACFLGVPTGVQSTATHTSFYCTCTGSNTCVVVRCNMGAPSDNPASGTFTAWVIK